ncbi:MAG: M16 family metallopeptidase [Pyrinomonadaceae bacterium]
MQKTDTPTGVSFVRQANGIREYRMANGMKVLLVENRVAPVATVLVLYKVGSRNEAVGYTGATHLLEHMMFKGTPTFNKTKNTQIAASLQRIGADFNATTWYDRTNYYETVPSDQIEFAIKLEADRMRNSLIADEDRQSEMTVVRNELDRGQNEPTEVLDEAVYATAFREHPYHHPTIGWRTDVEGVATSRLKTFYDTFYHPNNATFAIVGDFDEQHALSLIQKYFGAYPASQTEIPEVYTEEPEQQGERRLVIRRAGELAVVQIAFHTPGVLGQMNVLSNEELAKRAANPPAQNDIYPLVLLSVALSHGVTSRLYQALVETQLAVHVYTNCDQHRDPGLFNAVAMVRPGVEPRQVEEVILAELRKVADNGLTEAEIEKARQQILAHEAFSRDGTFNIAAQISEAEAVADWRFYTDYAANIEKVTPTDVRRVARAYFTEDNRTVGHFIPKKPDEAMASNGGNGSNGRNGNGSNGQAVQPRNISSRNLFSRKLIPRGVQFYREPDVYAEHAGASNLVNGSSNRASAGGGGATKFAARINRTELANGATLLVLENHATPTISLRGSLRAGSHFEPRDKPGLAMLTAEMLERGTRRRSKLQIATDLESVGAELSFSSDPFVVNIGARCLSKDLRLVLDTLAEELREPSFPADELEKLKQQTIADIQEQQSNTGYRAYERLTSLVFDPTNPYYLNPGEKLIESITAITVADVEDFYKECYGGRSLILSIAGDVQTSEARGQFEQAFGAFTGPASVDINVTDPEPQRDAKREIVFLKDKASIDVLLGSAASLRRDSKDYYAAVIANSALGMSTLSSRLGLQVRDKEGLTYGINSRFRAPSLAAGPWYIGVSVSPHNVERAINSALDVLRDYTQTGIRADELADEKSAAIGSFKVSLATNAGLARSLWNAEFFKLGADYIDRFPQLVEAVTLEDVNAAIRTHFRPDQLTIVIAGGYEEAAHAATPVS